MKMPTVDDRGKYCWRHHLSFLKYNSSSSIPAGKLLAVPCVAVVALGAGAVILVAGAVLGPFYGIYKIHQARMRKKKMKKWKTRHPRNGMHLKTSNTHSAKFADEIWKICRLDGHIDVRLRHWFTLVCWRWLYLLIYWLTMCPSYGLNKMS